MTKPSAGEKEMLEFLDGHKPIGKQNPDLPCFDTIRAAIAKGQPKVSAKIVCLCGSTRFTDTMLIESWEFAKQGIIALGWHALPDSYFENEPTDHMADKEGVRQIVDEVHKRKIDLADEIFVVNVGGYIGNSTKSEMRYAAQKEKPIYFHEPVYAEKNLCEAGLKDLVTQPPRKENRMTNPKVSEKEMLAYWENAIHAYNEFYGPGEREEADALRALIPEYFRMKESQPKVGNQEIANVILDSSGVSQSDKEQYHAILAIIEKGQPKICSCEDYEWLNAKLNSWAIFMEMHGQGLTENRGSFKFCPYCGGNLKMAEAELEESGKGE